MNATDTVAAAIQKLENHRDNSAAGPWVAHDTDPQMDGRNWQIRTEGVPGIRIVAHDYGYTENVELIVTLHRTIEPQLTILRDAMKSLSNQAYMEEFGEFVESTFRHPLLLARSILGEGEFA